MSLISSFPIELRASRRISKLCLKNTFFPPISTANKAAPTPILRLQFNSVRIQHGVHKARQHGNTDTHEKWPCHTAHTCCPNEAAKTCTAASNKRTLMEADDGKGRRHPPAANPLSPPLLPPPTALVGNELAAVPDANTDACFGVGGMFSSARRRRAGDGPLPAQGSALHTMASRSCPRGRWVMVQGV